MKVGVHLVDIFGIMEKELIEVVATSVHSCIEAERGGAGRIELCTALATAGLTPGPALLEEVKKYVSISVFVMIRPREGDFCYDNREIDLIKREIEILQNFGADGFVFGLLNEKNSIDIARTRMLVDFCKPYPVTFHRAIDCTADPVHSIEDVIETGCVRILTSGGAATGPEGRDIIEDMHTRARGRIAIMPGGGIRPDTFKNILIKGIYEYHLSGRMHVAPKNQTTLFDMSRAETSSDEIRRVTNMLSEFYSS
jgi:copper homeostasis protein